MDMHSDLIGACFVTQYWFEYFGGVKLFWDQELSGKSGIEGRSRQLILCVPSTCI